MTRAHGAPHCPLPYTTARWSSYGACERVVFLDLAEVVASAAVKHPVFGAFEKAVIEDPTHTRPVHAAVSCKRRACDAGNYGIVVLAVVG